MTDLEVECRNLYVECPFPKKPFISVVDLLEMVCHDIEVLKKEIKELKEEK